MNQQADEMQALVRAAQAARVEANLLVECVQRRMIRLAEGGWDEAAIEDARRVRRLMALGINLQGVEVIFHMRRSLIQMQQEMDEARQQMESLRRAHEREISRLLRELAGEG